MRFFAFLIFIGFITAVFLSCNSKKKEGDAISFSEAKETLRNINKVLVDKDREAIDSYIKLHRLDGMTDNGSGLFYLIWGDSIGPKANEGNIVAIEFTVALLDGTECYTSKKGNPKEFVVGMGGVEAGLDMGVRMMKVGQRAKFIIPPHLAHGLLGDNGKIPPRSIIVYDVHLLKVLEK